MLDTDICIYTMNNNETVRTRFIDEYSSGLAISAITEAELWYGVQNSKNPVKNTETLYAFLATVEIIPFDSLAAAEYGRVRVKLKRAGRPIGDRDMLIAAHAKAICLKLATNNIREFSRVEGLMIEDWTM